MIVPRFHVPTAAPGGRIALPEHSAHHARDVLRLGSGDIVELFDDAGATARGTILSSAPGGVVVRVDRFGNLVTNIDRKTVERLGQGVAITIDAAGQRIARLVATYAELPVDGVGALFGGTDHLELAAPSSSAATRLGLGRGAVVTVTKA